MKTRWVNHRRADFWTWALYVNDNDGLSIEDLRVTEPLWLFPLWKKVNPDYVDRADAE